MKALIAAALFLSNSAFAYAERTNRDAVVCFTDKVARDKVFGILGSYEPHANPFENEEIAATVASVQMLAMYEFSLPVGFPSHLREPMALAHTFDTYVRGIADRAATRHEVGERMRAVLDAAPLANWRAAPGVVALRAPDRDLILPSTCLAVHVTTRKDQDLYYDAALFARLSEIDRLSIAVEDMLDAATKFELTDTMLRHLTGMLISNDEWEAYDPYELHKLILPQDRWRFTVAVGGQIAWVCQTQGEFADGQPQKLFLARPFTAAVDAWTVAPAAVTSPSCYVDSDDVPLVRGEDGAIASFRGSVTVGALTATGMIVMPAGSDSWTVTDGTLSRAGQMLRFDGVAGLVADEPTQIIVKSSLGNIAERYGDLRACGDSDILTVFPGTLQPATLSCAYGRVFFEGSLHIVERQPVSFNADGSLRSL